MYNPTICTKSVQSVVQQLEMSFLTVWKIICEMLKVYPYRITRTQKLIEGQKKVRLVHNARESRCIRDQSSNNVQFYLKGTVKNRSSLIWSSDIPYGNQEIALHSPKIHFWCGCTITFMWPRGDTRRNQKTAFIYADRYLTS